MKTCITYWYPVLKMLEIPTPKTIIVHCDAPMVYLAYGEKFPDQKVYFEFIDRLKSACKQIGYPVFLRTGHLSHKHAWIDTCYLEKEKDLHQHVFSLAESSAMANIAGAPWPMDFWVVREMLKTKPYFYCFNKMPITRERRYFINDGKVICKHNYWPKLAFVDHSPTKGWEKKLEELNTWDDKEEQHLTKMSEKVGSMLSGFWSIDWLQDIRGNWYCIDMAEGKNSWHEPECKTMKKLENPKPPNK